MDEDQNKPELPVEPAPAPEQNVPQVITSTEPPAPKKPSPLKNKKILIPLIVVLLAGVAAALYFTVFKKDAKPVDNSKKQTSTETQTEEEESPVSDYEAQLEKFTNPTTGETWYDAPKEIPLPGWYKYEDPETTKYYEIGTRAGKTIYLSDTEEMGSWVQLFEKGADGKVSIIYRPDAYATYDADQEKNAKLGFADGVTFDTTTHYDSLSVPLQIDLGNGEFVTRQGSGYGSFIPAAYTDQNRKDTTSKQYGKSKLVRTERPYTDTGLTSVGYVLRLPISTELDLSYAPIGKKLDDIKWTVGSSSLTGGFAQIVRGCGGSSGTGSHGDKVGDADFVEAGTVNGQKVYEFKSTSHTLVQKAWQETKDYWAYALEPSSKAGAEEKALAQLSVEDFVKNHGIFAYNSPNNGWLIYTNNKYAPEGGCAKPVVYLYPTAPTAVNVKVGATVKVSDPLYNPATGWQTFAWPGGQLAVNGRVYDSLFWEGPGWGAYPGITQGTVVKQADAVATIRTQLKQQGLNDKETADFLEYWADKIPAKPYVRLTWFGNAELNELAPLAISPKPTTVIRVFLDMAGYDTPVAIPAQTLTATPRTGFTVVEWGGLSHTKLY